MTMQFLFLKHAIRPYKKILNLEIKEFVKKILNLCPKMKENSERIGIDS
jgi:hypothetical protein